MKVLGLSFFYHDSAAALLIDGRPVAMAEEERFSRKKNDFAFPKQAINFVLAKAHVKAEELDYVIFYEKPFLKLERILKTDLAVFPLAPYAFKESIKSLFLSKLWVRQLIAKELNVDAKKVLFAEHHLSHGASSFFCSPYEKAAVLTVDGVGEWAVTTIGVGEGTKIKILKEVHFPHSLGLTLFGLYRFSRIRDQRRGIQSNGDGALRQAEICRPGQTNDPIVRRRLIQTRFELL